jgi:hypothetical protein
MCTLQRAYYMYIHDIHSHMCIYIYIDLHIYIYIDLHIYTMYIHDIHSHIFSKTKPHFFEKIPKKKRRCDSGMHGRKTDVFRLSLDTRLLSIQVRMCQKRPSTEEEETYKRSRMCQKRPSTEEEETYKRSRMCQKRPSTEEEETYKRWLTYPEHCSVLSQGVLHSRSLLPLY